MRRVANGDDSCKHLFFLALSLENLHDNLLLLDEEGAHDLLPDCLVAQNTTVGSLNGLLTLGKSGLLLVAAIFKWLIYLTSFPYFWVKLSCVCLMFALCLLIDKKVMTYSYPKVT